MKTKRIIVVGSANQDYLVRVGTPPRAGETTIAHGLAKQPGGKGANQAVAAARLGGDVHFVGAVGRDDDGARILRSMQNDGVSVDEVRIVDGQPTGLALIWVDDEGENSITVVSGANSTVTGDRAVATIRRLAGPGALVSVQGELSVEVLEQSVRAAAAMGARVALNLAPYHDIAADVLALADPLIVNETEAAGVLGRPIPTVDAAVAALDELLALSTSAVITLGGQGAVWATTEARAHVRPTVPATIADTTGAGDAFVGALLRSLAGCDDDLGHAVELGSMAGSFAVQGVGAQTSYPRSDDLLGTDV